MKLHQVSKKVYRRFICENWQQPKQLTHDLLVHTNSENKIVARVLFDKNSVRYYVR